MTLPPKLALTGILMLTASAAQALELKLQAGAGYDTNPFKLADSFNPDGANYIDSRLHLSQDIEQLRLYGSVHNRSYERSAEDADSTRWTLGGRYRVSHRVGDVKARTSLSLVYSDWDKTYVSRRSGQVGSFASQPIADRYDYRQWHAQAKTRLRLSKALSTKLWLEARDRDYQDFQIAGLSNFDYRQLSLGNAWDFRPDSQGELSLELELNLRQFDDKRQKTLDGTSLAGTELEYRAARLKLAYQRDLNEHHSLGLGYALELREDNGPGYYDTDDHRLWLEWGFRPQQQVELELTLGYQDREYVNTTGIDESNDGEPSRDGYFARLELSRQMPQWPGDPRLFANLRVEDFDSNDSAYAYDRAQVQAGVKVVF